MPKYENALQVADTFGHTVPRARASLAERGFGILTEIDVDTILKARINRHMPAYRIHGACNPQFAFTARGIDPSIGLLLPCNIVVRNLKTNRNLVEALDPTVVVTATGNPSFADVAAQPATLLAGVLSELVAPASHSTPTQQSR